MEKASTLKKIRIEVTGTTPLMMDMMSEEKLLAIREKRKKPKSAQPTMTPREEASQKVYESNGKPYVPAKYFMAALIGAGQYVRLDGRRQMSTKTTTMVPGFVEIGENVFPLTDMEGRSAKWEPDIQGGKNSSGEAVCIIRPRFDQWRFVVTLILDTGSLNEATYRELVDIAISKMGLGAFRPSKKGTFGKAVVTKWQTL